jgi:hypothetical protein
MTYLGHFSNGYIKLDDSVTLPEGTPVAVEVLTDASATEPHAGDNTEVSPIGSAEQDTGENSLGDNPTIWAKLRALAGTAEGLPPDAARNHDHYLYGLPKQP